MKELDEVFLPMATFIDELSALDGAVEGPFTDEQYMQMEIEKVEMGLPVQMEIIVDEEGKVTLGTIPPLYYYETSIMPVFHQLTLKLEKY